MLKSVLETLWLDTDLWDVSLNRRWLLGLKWRLVRSSGFWSWSKDMWGLVLTELLLWTGEFTNPTCFCAQPETATSSLRVWDTFTVSSTSEERWAKRRATRRPRARLRAAVIPARDVLYCCPLRHHNWRQSYFPKNWREGRESKSSDWCSSGPESDNHDLGKQVGGFLETSASIHFIELWGWDTDVGILRNVRCENVWKQ